MLACKVGLRIVSAAAALLIALHAAGARADAASDAAYRQVVDDAVREFTAERWEEARALFKRAHEMQPSARTLRGLGMTAFELRMYVQALRELEAALQQTVRPLSPEMRTQVEQLAVKARAFVGRVQLVSEPPSAKLLIDGKEFTREPDGSVLLDVGNHVVSATLDGFKPTNLRIAVEAGDQTVRVPLEPLLAIAAVPAIDPLAPPKPAQPAEPAPTAAPPPAPEPSPKPARQSSSVLPTVAWIALAAGAAFGVASGVFWAIGDGKVKKLESECGNRCSDAQIANSGIKGTDTLTTVFLVAAGAAVATSGVLFAVHLGSSDEPEGDLALTISPVGAAVQGSF